MKKIQIAIFLAAMLAFFSACSGPLSDRQQLEQLKRDLIQAQEENGQLAARLDALEQQLQQATPEQAPCGQDQAALDDLMGRPELIPGYDPKSPWAMRFYPELAKTLGNGLAYAYAEDGHQSAELLLRYSGGPGEGGYQWTLEAYSHDGGGWKTPEE